MGLRIALDLRPRGPNVWARALAGALVAAGPEHEWITDGWRDADLVLALTGARPRFGPPAWTAVHDPRPGWSAAWTTRQSERVIAPSQVVAHALRTYLRVPERRLVALPPIAPAGFRRARRAEVEAFRDRRGLPPLWVVSLGHPPRVGVAVVMAWELQEAELPVAMSGAVAVLDPDPRSGNAAGVLEGMACGAPAVVAAGSAGAEVIGGAGVLVDARDAEGWAAAVSFLVQHREERNRMAARALRAGAQFRAEVAARRLLEELGAAAPAGTRAAGAG